MNTITQTCDMKIYYKTPVEQIDSQKDEIIGKREGT